MEQRQIGIFNVENNSYIWYHSTPSGLVSKIRKEGLKINSIPTYQDLPEPRIFISTHPFIFSPDFVTFRVDLSYFPIKYAKWPFNEGDKPLEERWQLCIYHDISPHLLTPFF